MKRALFGKVQNVTLFVEDNYGDDVTRLSYLGFKGVREAGGFLS